jgi:ABC-2 type transport system ATP-binding protein
VSNSAIEVRSLAKRFSRKTVLKEVTLHVPAGKTYAFLGRNGAGKTTTIRTLLGLLEPDAGQLSVLGLNPKTQAVEVRRRVGYMAEGQAMFGWMRVAEVMRFVASFYPTWDGKLASRLAGDFELPERARVRNLSQGQNTRLALLLALAHCPELVILDDPTLGLDPIMRKEFLRDVVQHLQGAGATVFFSSHLLYEIEPVADVVGILEGGRIIVQSETEQLREKVKQLLLSTESYRQLTKLPGELDVTVRDSQAAVVVEDAEEALRALGSAGVQAQAIELNLDEIFKAYVAGNRGIRP